MIGENVARTESGVAKATGETWDSLFESLDPVTANEIPISLL